jgi:hypothetical protein
MSQRLRFAAESVHKKTALRYGTTVRLFNFLLVVRWCAARRSSAARWGRTALRRSATEFSGSALGFESAAAFGVFGWLQVTNFDVFLFVWHISFSLLGCLWLLVVLYHWHRITIAIARRQHSLLGSGHPSGSIYPSCALAFDSLTLRRAHSFCLSVHSLRRPIISMCAKVWQRLPRGVLLIYHEAFLKP